MKNKAYHTIRTVQKYSSKTVERGKVDITNIQYMTAQISGGVKLAYVTKP